MEHRNFHLLGYHFSEDASNIKALCMLKQKNKELRNRRMIEFLRSKGIDLALEEVADIAGGTNISRPHFAQLMVKKAMYPQCGKPLTLDKAQTQELADMAKERKLVLMEAIKTAYRPGFTQFWVLPAAVPLEKSVV